MPIPSRFLTALVDASSGMDLGYSHMRKCLEEIEVPFLLLKRRDRIPHTYTEYGIVHSEYLIGYDKLRLIIRF